MEFGEPWESRELLHLLEEVAESASAAEGREEESRERLELQFGRFREATEERVAALSSRVEQLGLLTRAASESRSAAGSVGAIHEEVRELVGAVGGTQDAIGMIRAAHESLSIDVHSFFVAQGLGVDTNKIPLRRFLPVRVYLQDSSLEDVAGVASQVEKAIALLGFDFAEDFPAEEGSFRKGWFVKSKELLTQDEVTDRLKKIEKALEIKHLDGPQAEVARVLSEAIRNLKELVSDQSSAAIQCGPILLVKTTNRGKSSLQVRTLTPREVIHLERNQDLLTNPATIMKELAEAADEPSPIIQIEGD